MSATVFDVQGGSNMTGTICIIVQTLQSRSYLNHLVHNQNETNHT
jgi:hypothetical protein